jgi:hypothetical protein
VIPNMQLSGESIPGVVRYRDGVSFHPEVALVAHDDLDTVPLKTDDATEAVCRPWFADHEASGRSVRDWCRTHDIPERQFHRRRLKPLGPVTLRWSSVTDSSDREILPIC